MRSPAFILVAALLPSVFALPSEGGSQLQGRDKPKLNQYASMSDW
jgi:hypothetical protein